MPQLLYKADEDDDDLVLQRLAFPISECDAEETSGSGPPANGLEYLHRVRREARSLPAVICKPAPRTNEEDGGPLIPLGRSMPLSSREWIPHEHWEHQVVSEFSELANRLRSASAMHRTASSAAHALPSFSDSSAWEVFCLGSSNTGVPGHLPVVSLILQLQQRSALAILQTLSARLERDGCMSSQLARWQYALLLRLEPALPSDGAAILRGLVFTCAHLRCRLSELSREEAEKCAPAINAILCILGKYFGQASNEELRACEEDCAGRCDKDGDVDDA